MYAHATGTKVENTRLSYAVTAAEASQLFWDGRLEWLITALRQRVVVVKIVDQFLGPHRIALGQHTVVEHAPHKAVRCCVHVHGKCRYRIFADQLDRVLLEGLEMVPAHVLVVR